MDIFRTVSIGAASALAALTFSVVNMRGPEPDVIDIRAKQPAHVVLAPQEEEYDILTSDEVTIITKLVTAEAGGESEYGKRLVIDTVLNRVDSPHFPDNVHDVIYQKNQFAVRRAEALDADAETAALVREESENRTNDEVIFFNSVGYTKYGTALFKEGGHYFSKYKE